MQLFSASPLLWGSPVSLGRSVPPVAGFPREARGGVTLLRFVGVQDVLVSVQGRGQTGMLRGKERNGVGECGAYFLWGRGSGERVFIRWRCGEVRGSVGVSGGNGDGSVRRST